MSASNRTVPPEECALGRRDSFAGRCAIVELDVKLGGLKPSYENLPVDIYSPLSGRCRRIAQFCCKFGSRWSLQLLPNRPFLQERRFNRVFGGLQRRYAALEIDPSAIVHQAAIALDLDQAETWQVNVHQIRVTARRGSPGRVVPEGPHQDGHRFVAIVVVDRQGIDGGITVVTRAHSKTPVFEGIVRSGETIILDDRSFFHYTTDVVARGQRGFRDTMIVVFNRWHERKYGPAFEERAIVKDLSIFRER